MNVHEPVLDAALQFFIVTGETDPVIDFRLLPESKTRLERDASGVGLQRRFKVRGTLVEIAKLLIKRNDEGDAVFFTVNETDGNGAGKKNIVRARCLVLDLDDALLPRKWRIQPHLIVETSPGKHHVYWAINPTEDIAAYENISRRLAAKYQGDENVCDASHIFRVATFLHHKRKPFRSRIVWSHPRPDELEFDRLSLSDFEWLPELEKLAKEASRPADGLLTERLAEEILSHLEVEKFDSNKSWFELAASLHDACAGDPAVRDAFLGWCATDSKYSAEYHEMNNLRRWESLRTDKDRRKTVGTLFMLCRAHGVPDRISAKLIRKPVEFDPLPDDEAEFEGEPEVMFLR